MRIWLLIGAVIMLLIEAAPASACTCKRIRSDNECRKFLGKPDYVFRGTVDKKTLRRHGRGVISMRVRVTQQIKGKLPETVNVDTASTGPACGLGLAVGESSLFPVYGGVHSLRVNRCTRNLYVECARRVRPSLLN